MYAIVEIGGKQYKVVKDHYIYVYRLQGAEGDAVTFDNVLLLADNSQFQVGAPTVAGAKVSGKILEHLKDDKVVAFKKKRRKGFRKTVGFRQSLTKVLITSLN